jgi:hypothetical protein
MKERRAGRHATIESKINKAFEAGLDADVKPKFDASNTPDMVEDHAPAGDDKKPLDESRYDEGFLGAWFPPIWPSESTYTEYDIQGIARDLRHAEEPLWSQVPRLCTVLRLIDRVRIIEQLIETGVTNLWFPFSEHCLPEVLKSQYLAVDFFKQQARVMTGAMNLEIGRGRHMHLASSADVNSLFVVTGDLGKGGTGFVQRIQLRSSNSNPAIDKQSSRITGMKQQIMTESPDDERKSDASHKNTRESALCLAERFRRTNPRYATSKRHLAYSRSSDTRTSSSLWRVIATQSEYAEQGQSHANIL